MADIDVELLLTAASEGQMRIFNMYREAFDKWEKEVAGPEGWWKSDTSDQLFGVFMMMTNKHGMETDLALANLSTVVSAMRSEYEE